MLRLKQLPHYVHDDYVLWRDRWEIIGGIPFSMTPSPSFRHQRISQKIWLFIGAGLTEMQALSGPASRRLEDNKRYGGSAG